MYAAEIVLELKKTYPDITLESAIPVSYTHLDVYKRQGSSRSATRNLVLNSRSFTVRKPMMTSFITLSSVDLMREKSEALRGLELSLIHI